MRNIEPKVNENPPEKRKILNWKEENQVEANGKILLINHAGVSEKILFDKPLIKGKKENGDVNMNCTDYKNVVQFRARQFDVAEENEEKANRREKTQRNKVEPFVSINYVES